jgi:hypothetical protein
MKTSRGWAGALLAGSLLLTSIGMAVAQGNGHGNGAGAGDAKMHGGKMQGAGHGEGMRGRGMDADALLQRMTKHLNLTSKQQTQIKPILQNMVKQTQPIVQNQALKREDKMAKIKPIREAAHKKIDAILTPEQRKKLAEGMARGEHQGGKGDMHGKAGHADSGKAH